ncbi:MAG: ATP-binding protein [Candidatus Altiarchaeota archaeon]|nr:ATP-binding protein [Candidatus Altiarchaeota archaeon]
MEKTRLRQVITDHQEFFRREENMIDRDINLNYLLKGKEIIIISGIRRCGKSTLLKIISKRIKGEKLFINFDDIRLTDFTKNNFLDIEDLAYELLGTDDITYFFDEIQNAEHWERWVNNLHGKNKKIFLTGSNSKLLSSEISTYLTGRNKVLKLSPFSFKEFLKLNEIKNDNLTRIPTKEKNKIFKLFLQYFEAGGFPVICRNEDIELSKQYFEDILNKDVLTRYQIRHIKEVKDLVIYLFSNTGKTYSYSTLKKITGIKSLSTIKNYIDYLRNVFLLYTINRFDYSIRKQKVSSSKPYIADNSFFKTISFNFSENRGRRMENLVFLQLLRQNKEVYYHNKKKECDFVVKQGLGISEAIQVCFDLSDQGVRKREIGGLLEAMTSYKLKTGLILTLDSEDELEIENKKIITKPVWKWLLENK